MDQAKVDLLEAKYAADATLSERWAFNEVILETILNYTYLPKPTRPARNGWLYLLMHEKGLPFLTSEGMGVPYKVKAQAIHVFRAGMAQTETRYKKYQTDTKNAAAGKPNAPEFAKKMLEYDNTVGAWYLIRYYLPRNIANELPRPVLDMIDRALNYVLRGVKVNGMEFGLPPFQETIATKSPTTEQTELLRQIFPNEDPMEMFIRAGEAMFQRIMAQNAGPIFIH